jgi:hypothetical protein
LPGTCGDTRLRPPKPGQNKSGRNTPHENAF